MFLCSKYSSDLPGQLLKPSPFTRSKFLIRVANELIFVFGVLGLSFKESPLVFHDHAIITCNN